MRKTLIRLTILLLCLYSFPNNLILPHQSEPTTGGSLDLKRPDEVELLRDALGDVSGLPDRLGSSLLELLNKKDDKRRPAAIRELLEELACE